MTSGQKIDRKCQNAVTNGPALYRTNGLDNRRYEGLDALYYRPLASVVSMLGNKVVSVTFGYGERADRATDGAAVAVTDKHASLG